jgi:hypothetical protein
MVERYSWAQVNHYLWRRQGFAWDQDRGPRPVLESLIGIYATAPTSYLTVLARQPGFRFPDMDAFLVEQRRAVRMRAMRYSNFIIPVELLPAVYQATKTDRANPFMQMLKLSMTEAQYVEVAQDIQQLLGDGRRPRPGGQDGLTAGEIKKALPPAHAALGEALNYVIPQMCAEGRLVRAAVRGGWKSDLYEYARFDRWLPGVDLDQVSPEQGRVILAREYFDSFGPVSAEDFRWWSGLSKEAAERAMAAQGGQMVPVQVDGIDHWLLAARLDDLRQCPAEPPQGVRLLPVWDAYLMAYKARRRYLPDGWYDSVYAATGDATSTVLLNGAVGGMWGFQEEKKTLVVKVGLFEPAGQGVWHALRDQVVGLAQVAGYPSAVLVRCQPVTLSGGAQNLFKSPLKAATGETIFRM